MAVAEVDAVTAGVLGQYVALGRPAGGHGVADGDALLGVADSGREDARQVELAAAPPLERRAHRVDGAWHAGGEHAAGGQMAVAVRLQIVEGEGAGRRSTAVDRPQAARGALV